MTGASDAEVVDVAEPEDATVDAAPVDAAVIDVALPLVDAAPIDAALPHIDAALPVIDAALPHIDAALPVPDAAMNLPDAGVPPDVDGRITINEFMAYNAMTIKDDTGVASDWLELYNPTNRDIPLAGYGLSDNLAIPRRAVVPAGVVLRAGGHLVFWLDHAPAKGPMHLGFHLNRHAGDIVLERPNGTPIDRITYATQANDFSAAREPDGSNFWKIEWHASPGAANPAGPGTPVGIEVPGAPPERVPAAGDLSERILGYDEMPQFEITLTPASFAALESNPRQYVPGHLVFDGRTFGPVGVRLKGWGSFEPITRKPSLRINIDEYVAGAELFGLKDLTFDNMDNDFTMMHERVAYRVARLAGIPASRSNHMLLRINGTFYGLYANVESVKKRILTRWFANAGGTLLDGHDVDFTPGYIDAYKLQAGPNDRSLLIGLVDALMLSSADAAIAAASGYANLPQFRRFWAMCAVIGQFDSFPYSMPGDDYFIYADPTTHRLWFMPWGMDETFYSAEIDVKEVSSVLAMKCLQSPACFQDFANQTWDILALTEGIDLEGERVRVADQIAPYVWMDTHKPYTSEQVAAYQMDMFYFINERRARLTQMLPPRSP